LEKEEKKASPNKNINLNYILKKIKMAQNKGTIESVAREKVENRFGLINHFVVYVIVNGFLFGFDHFFTTRADWSYIPLFGWGIGLFIHALFVLFDEFLESWKEKMVKSEVKKLKNKT
jgi:uncharacterized membrane protein